MSAPVATGAPTVPVRGAPGGGANWRRGRRRRQTGLRVAVFAVTGVFFLIPLLAMLGFSTRAPDGRSWDAWTTLVRDEAVRSSIITSLQLAALTAVLMLLLLVPTMIWVRLRVPGLSRTVEFLCLLPLAIPAIALVVGFTNVQAWVTYFVGDTPLSLTFVYVVLVLPFAYRSLDAGLGAIDAVTLSEAARTLGASWFTVIVRVVLPGIRSAVLAAAMITVALVLGEFTFASLLNYDTLPVKIALLGKGAAVQVSVAASLASILFALVLLLSLSFVGRRRGRAEE
uniref:ABC transporter, permease protein 2 (Cluster 1, maltose/g3p/polyamine/iron) n=1 Tax=uncultured Nocardioidaceae bacterium TaxID=253824 RepID=A0A6J4KQV0_9ACTN|nr:MAG: ABC transporter, permease protein 2 (cluster 1, maltose/g3p/polyamine/iron) [uncultured Nocardioidaceae bacterium]